MSGPKVRRRVVRPPRDPEARVLAESTDELNAVFEAAAEQLASLGLGVEASVALGRWTDVEDGTEYWRSLSFMKRGDQWRLFIGEWTVHDEPTLTPLTSAPREQRVQAAHMLPQLLDAMREAVRKETARVRAAKAAVESFMASLGSEEGEP